MPRSLPVLTQPHTHTQKLLVLLGCYLLLQLWYICTQALVLAAALLVFMSFIRNNVGKEGEVGGEASPSCDHEIEGWQLDYASTQHLQSSSRPGASKSTDQQLCMSLQTQNNVVLPDTSMTSHTRNTLGEVLQHRYMLRPRSNYLSQQQRAVILSWLDDVNKAESGVERPAQTFPSVTKVGAIVPLTTRRLAQHLRSSNGGLRSCQAEIDASAYTSPRGPITKSSTAFLPTKRTSSPEKPTPAMIPSSLFMSKAQKAEPRCSTKDAVAAVFSNSKEAPIGASKHSGGVVVDPLSSLDSSDFSSSRRLSPEASVPHTTTTSRTSCGCAPVATKQDELPIDEDSGDTGHVDRMLSLDQGMKVSPRNDRNKTPADRLLALIAKLNE